MKKYEKYLIPSIVVLAAIVFLLENFILDQGMGINVKVINNTESIITGLKITYTDLNNLIEIPDIEANGIYKTKVELTDLEDEGSMELYYVDKLDNEERTIIVGYIEPGYKGKVEVTVNSIDANGKLDIQASEDIDIF